jgi:microcystin-dependent protein
VPDERFEAVMADLERRLKALERSSGQFVPVGNCYWHPGDITGSGLIEPEPGAFYCNGAQFSGVTYPKLAAKLGSAFLVSGTTYKLPDYSNGRSPIGKGAAFPTIGAQGGAATHTLSTAELPIHNHPLTIATDNAPHSHPGGPWVLPAGGGSLPAGSGYGNTSGVGTANAPHNHPGSSVGNAGSGSAHNNMPPYEVGGGWLIVHD